MFIILLGVPEGLAGMAEKINIGHIRRSVFRPSTFVGRGGSPDG
jgi:hypothetical protein